MQKTFTHCNETSLKTQPSYKAQLLESEPPRLQIARVPRDKAIGQDRYYLEIYQPADRMAWHFPIQLRREEGYRILGMLDAAIEPGMLGLSHSDGFPIYAAELYDLLEALIDGGLH